MNINIIDKTGKSYLENVNSDYGFKVARKLLEYKTIPEGFRNAGTQAENC